MRRKPIIISKEILVELYLEQDLTMKEIADKLGYSITPIFRSIKRHGIPTKPMKHYTRRGLNIFKPELEDLYIKKKWTLTSLAGHYKVKVDTIRSILVDYGISIRSTLEVLKLSAPSRVWDKDGHGRNWQGGRSKNTTNGYTTIWMPEHHRASKQGYVYEHILVWEQTYNKHVPDGYHVHHLNGVRTDNRPENLQALPQGEHIGLARPYKKRILELEAELKELQQLKLTIARRII